MNLLFWRIFGTFESSQGHKVAMYRCNDFYCITVDNVVIGVAQGISIASILFKNACDLLYVMGLTECDG